MTNDDILAIFFQECEEALAVAEQGLMDCQEGNADLETVNSIFRSVHSIKGGAGAFGFLPLQAYTHKFETLLSFVREGKIALGEALVGLLLRAFDVLADHVTAAQGQAATPDDAAVSAELEAMSDRAEAGEDMTVPSDPAPAEPELIEEPVAEVAPEADDGLDFDLDSLIGAIDADDAHAVAAVPAAAQVTFWTVTIRPRAGALCNGSEPLLLLRELDAHGGRCVEVDAGALPTLDKFDPEATYLAWRYEVPVETSEAAIREIFDFVGEDCDLDIVAGPAEGPLAELTPAPVKSATKSAPKSKAEPATTPVAAVSAAPVAAPAPVAAAPTTPAPATAPAASTANKAPVAAGQTIRVDLGKLDRLIDTVGELVIAQAMMAQRLTDHGLAAIDELGMLDQLTRELQDSAMSIRAQPIGSVFSRVPRIVRELEAETGKRVRLEVIGEHTELDKTVVERLGEPLTHLIRNAVDHGLETPDVRIAAGKAAEGVLRLSAEHRSGRILISIADDGAGINRERVLAKAIEKGLVAPDAQLSAEEIDHLIFAPGFSTAQTVSNISGRGVGMDVVRQNVKDLGGRITIQSNPGKGSVFTLALPLTLAISDGMIVRVGDQTLVVPLTHVVESLRPASDDLRPMGNGRHMLNVRGTFLPIIPVDGQINAIGATERAEEGVLIVVETEGSGSAVLMVDTILDQRQFVIKSLEANYRPVPCVAGATILGDGTVALILDVDTLVGSVVNGAANVRIAA
jgi:two-component system, chemotaxis family, sensor kinase CheA